MVAQPGDWLVIAAPTDRGGRRRGEILSVESVRGDPRYTVRWADSGRTAIVFPGPGATVMSASALRKADRRADRPLHA